MILLLTGLAACSSSTSGLDASGSDAQVADTAAADAAPQDALPPDLGRADAGFMDAVVTDTGGLDAEPSDLVFFDATFDAGPADTGAPDTGIWGPIGSLHNPAPSCKVILSMVPTSSSGAYYILPTATTATVHNTWCDMRTDSGGFTKIAGFSNIEVNAIRGATGHEMLKCADNGTEYIESPTSSLAWSWGGLDRFRQVPGTWKVNDTSQACDSNPEYTQYTCASWWGWGCGNGGGNQNKLFPGVLDQPSAGYCADTTSAHTNATFSICTNSNGPDNFRNYSVFMRAD
jgi:hypothetical protein